jgi:hypothetical protein
MAQDHYKVLGVSRNATGNDIKSAYRKIVLAHHPDKSPSRESAEIFLRATEAYDVLGDPDKRKHYDVVRENEHRRVAQAQSRPQARPQPSAPGPTPKTQSKPQTQTGGKGGGVMTVAADVTRLTLIFTRGQYSESEKLAKSILTKDNRQPIPYAVLGDIARAKGNLDEAAKMYAFAAQMDPRNPVYQQRHEELINTARGKLGPSGKRMDTEGKPVMTIIVGSILLLSAALYVMIAREIPIMPSFGLVSTWTLGLCVMVFLSGVSMGALLCASSVLDRFSVSTTNSIGKISSPMIALTSIAVVNFWAAAVLYGAICLAQKGSNINHVRFVGAIAITTLLMAGAASFSVSSISPGQVLLWGGNLCYIGGICGWMVSDSFKKI